MTHLIETHTYTSKKVGPHVVLMAGVHGDEPAGVDALTALRAKLDSMPFCGTITFVVANRRALNANIRFMDTDLNRLFSEREVTRVKALEPMERNHEERIAIELSEVLQAADFMLDLHSTIQPSVPFLYAENTPTHRRLLSQLSVQTAVLSNPAFQPASLVSSADNYVDRMGGVGITLESGGKDAPRHLDFLLEQIHLFLIAVGSIKAAEPMKHEPPLFYTPTAKITLPTNGFSPINPWENFAPVQAQQVLLQKGETSIISPTNGVLLFPKKKLTNGQIATYIAEQLTE